MKLLEAGNAFQPVWKAHLRTLLYCYFASRPFVLTKTRLYARLGSSETEDSVELEDEERGEKKRSQMKSFS